MKDKIINGYPFELYKKETLDTPQVIKKSADFLRFMDKRRTVRSFSSRAVPKEVIENIIQTASTSPSAGHTQPWTFCAVSNPKLKNTIRESIEREEQENDIKPLQTDVGKTYITEAPWLIVLFKRIAEPSVNTRNRNVDQSIGIATGILISAIHNAGLASVTYTPESVGFLKEKLGRPENEEPFMLIAVGYAADNCYVPKLIRKGLKDIAVFYEE